MNLWKASQKKMAYELYFEENHEFYEVDIGESALQACVKAVGWKM